MTIPDWTEAPEGATHWDEIADCFCDDGGWWHKYKYVPVENVAWGTDRYTPRPAHEWEPIVGESCQVIELPGTYIKCEILANRHGDYIYYVPEKHGFGMLAAGAFRPARTQAQIEREELEFIISGALLFGIATEEIVNCIIEKGYRIVK